MTPSFITWKMESWDESRYFYDLRKLALELGTKPEKIIWLLSTICGYKFDKI